MWQLAYPISNSDIDRFRQNGSWEIAETWHEASKGYIIGRQYRVHKAQEIKLRWGGFAAFSRSSKDQIPVAWRFGYATPIIISEFLRAR